MAQRRVRVRERIINRHRLARRRFGLGKSLVRGKHAVAGNDIVIGSQTSPGRRVVGIEGYRLLERLQCLFERIIGPPVIGVLPAQVSLIGVAVLGGRLGELPGFFGSELETKLFGYLLCDLRLSAREFLSREIELLAPKL